MAESNLEDVSFRKDGSVVKKKLQSGHGKMPTDASLVKIFVKAVTAGSVLAGPMTVDFTLGNGEVCDALECACSQMALGEEAIVMCKPSMAIDEKLSLKLPETSEQVAFHIVLMDCTKQPPDKREMTESERWEFVLQRKAVAESLFLADRVELAFQRYSGAVRFLDYVDKLFSDEAAQAKAKDLKLACQLNRAACALKLGDAKRAAICCSSVLAHDPRNAKALLRRATANIALQKYACGRRSKAML